jgi:hypothetical protein
MLPKLIRGFDSLRPLQSSACSARSTPVRIGPALPAPYSQKAPSPPAKQYVAARK